MGGLGTTNGPLTSLLGRNQELQQLEELLARARTGGSVSVVIRGDPGIGKTALLEHLIVVTSGFQVARAVGVEGEVDLPYAGLHQLCRPMIDSIATLPQLQAEALEVAFALTTGRHPTGFLSGSRF